MHWSIVLSCPLFLSLDFFFFQNLHPKIIEYDITILSIVMPVSSYSVEVSGLAKKGRKLSVLFEYQGSEHIHE